MYKKLTHCVQIAVAALMAMLFWCPSVRAANEEDEQAIDVAAVEKARIGRQQIGLHKTIGGFLSVKNVSVANSRDIELCVPGLRQKMPVLAVIQSAQAPLVVVLPGIGGRTDADFSKLWPSWLAEAGLHVLTFNSTFRPEFIDISGDGPSGNVWSESEKIRDIIAEFLRRPEIAGRVSQLGLVGMSYGGTQALILGRMQHEGRLPFKFDAIHAYSPPLKMERTAALFDQWWNEDRWHYTLAEIAATFTPEGFCGKTFSTRAMRAAIAVSFHHEFPQVVIKNNDEFELKLLPRGDEYSGRYWKEDWANTWGFQKYAYELAIPWWRDHKGVDADTLINATHVSALLRQQPRATKIIIAADDPFDYPDDMRELRACANGQVLFLDTGGHLGYVAEPETRERLTALFAEK